MLGLAWSEVPCLTMRVIIFELTQTKWTEYLNVTNRRTPDGQTDG